MDHPEAGHSDFIGETFTDMNEVTIKDIVFIDAI